MADLTASERNFIEESWSVADAFTGLCWLKDARPDWFAELADVVETARAERRPW